MSSGTFWRSIFVIAAWARAIWAPKSASHSSASVVGCGIGFDVCLAITIRRREGTLVTDHGRIGCYSVVCA